MNKSILILFFCMILLAGVRAEYSLWETQLMNNISSDYYYNSTVQDHIFFQFDDTSIEDVGKNKPIEMQLYYSIMPLPYVLTGYGGEVDRCSLIVRHFKNIYDSDGNRINTTLEYVRMNFTTNLSSDFGYINFDMRSDDTLSGDIYCHYSNVSTLYVENVLVGRFTSYLPSFECNGCSDYTIEELSNEVERNDEIFIQQTAIYHNMQNFVDMDFKVWLILKWVISIAFLFVAIGLIFYSGYYFYSLIKRLESGI